LFPPLVLMLAPTAVAGVSLHSQSRSLHLIEKTRLIPPRDGRDVVTGFISYVDSRKPVLVHCHGWQDYSDAYDDYGYEISADNGITWSARRELFRSSAHSRGKVRYAEPAVFWDGRRARLIVLVDRALYVKDAHTAQTRTEVFERVYDPAAGKWSEERPIGVAPGRSMAVSFSFPILTKRGTILVPAFWALEDQPGRNEIDPRSRQPVHQSITIRGIRAKDGGIRWELGGAIPVDRSVTTRGLGEHTYAQLSDGRIVAVIRGSNAGATDLPGRKWVSFSEDDGLTWTDAEPLRDAQGKALLSGANGSSFIRHKRTGRLFWLGNLCREGETATGNWPRHTLYLVEVQEKPFALRMDRAFIVDRDGPEDSPDLQLSNFRWYEDRETGDIVIYLTRLGEHGMKRWQDADYCRYRVGVR